MNKAIVLCVLLSGLVVSASATLNKDAMMGVNKTQSAQSLGHSKLGFSLLGDVTNETSMFKDRGDTLGQMTRFHNIGGQTSANASDFWGASAYVALAVGIWDYFDFGVMLPVYYEKFTSDKIRPQEETLDVTGTDVGGLGDMRASLKIRMPLPEDQVFDIALVGGASFGTTDLTRQGMWVREPEYIHVSTNDTNVREAQSFGIKETTLRGTLALTVDFDKLDNGVPLQFHVNGGYRYIMDAGDFNDHIMSFSGAFEFFPVEFFSIFAEYYMDFMPDIEYKGTKESLDLSQITAALVFHTPAGVDLHLGGSYYVGGDKYISALKSYHNDDPNNGGYIQSNTRVNPLYTVYGGITWAGFLLPQDRDNDGVTDEEDKCPDEYGHKKNQGCPLGEPDLDEDGVCDPWVAEKGLLDEFADACDGIDQCPNEEGEGEDGCPLDEPDTDADGICDPWVTQKKMSKKFADVCKGADNCPNEKGPKANLGCPTDNPDADGDKICDPWVSQKNKLSAFAEMCKGYDDCPGEAGPVANRGCPWPDPDADGDGLCDEWVIQKKMGYFFENPTDSTTKKCKGVDKCPAEYGPIDNDGCPLDNPDGDGDGVCDAWVTQKKMTERFADVCKGIDKCPEEAGPEFNNGCKMDNPDADSDSICDPWVSQKKMLDKFATVCKDIDKCPTEPGPAATNGCPLDDPDLDKDSVCAVWVTEKGMLNLFKGVCSGADKCPLDVGPLDNSGCPLDNPDGDSDGVCDPWVTQKKMNAKFKDICTGMDRCPLDPGPVAANGCPAPEIKENVKLEGVTFKSGSALLAANAKTVLKSIAEQLNAPENLKVNIEIHGHTDNVGKPAKNKKLSQDRAQSVVNYLATQGVAKSRMTAIGHGDEEPVADNKTAEGREANRRIEMHRAQ